MKKFNRMVLVLLVAMVLCGPVFAQDDVPQEVRSLIERAGQYYKGLNSFRFDLHSETNMEMGGMKQNTTTKQVIRFEEPNKLAIETTEGQGGTLVTNGETITAYHPAFNKYSIQEAPENFNDVQEMKYEPDFAIVVAQTIQGGFLPLMVSETPGDSMMHNVTSATYLGKQEMDGQELEGILLGGEEMDIAYWFDTGDTPLLRKVLPDLESAQKKMAESNPMMKNLKIENKIAISNWEINPEFNQTTFTFEAPSSAEKVDSLLAALQESMGMGGGAQQSNPLEGKPAPNFTLPFYEGGQFELAKQKGQPVVLDFWASWCGPCRQGMPILHDAVDQLNETLTDGEKIKLIAVNVQEDKNAIQSFLKSQELTLTVVMDQEGSVSKRYDVTGIPQTVFIDKEGNVKKVKVGMLPKSMVMRELKSLVQ